MRPEPATGVLSSEAGRVISTLLEINNQITSILDLDELLNKIAEQTNQIIPYEIFAIFLLDDEKQELFLRFAIGHPPDVVRDLRIKVGDGVTGTAALERTTVVVDDVRQYPRYIEAVKHARSELAVPLISRNRVVGVLDIESPELSYFREDQVKLLNLLAGQIAIAIENARVYESERRNRELLALLYDISLEMSSTLEVDELVRKIAGAVKQKINYHTFSIFLLDEKQGLLRPKFVIRSNCCDAATESLTAALGERAGWTGKPSSMIASAATELGRAVGLSEPELERIRVASLLHDLGKLAIPEAILTKPSELDEPEWRVIAEHPKIGQVVLEQAGALRDAATIVLHHHEWYDGRGYPHGLSGEDIPVGARIVAIADAYEAMVAGRPYRAAITHSEAIAESAPPWRCPVRPGARGTVRRPVRRVHAVPGRGVQRPGPRSRRPAPRSSGRRRSSPRNYRRRAPRSAPSGGPPGQGRQPPFERQGRLRQDS